MRRLAVTAAVIGCLCAAVPADAQRRESVSLLMGFGNAYSGGEYRDGFMAAFDVVIARRVGQNSGVAPVAEVDIAAQTPLGGTEDICIVTPLSAPDCVPRFPVVLMVAALLGLENANAIWRVSAGPAYVRASENWQRDDAANTLGLTLRAEAATPPLAHLSLVFSARGMFVPSYRDDSIWYAAYQVGLRIR